MLANEAFGWCWITLGLLSGAWIGMRFGDERWLGGYSAYPRRMVRLGHIALVMLGVLNVLFALSAARIALPAALVTVAAWELVAGAVLMPLTCFVSARRGDARGAPLLFTPAVILLVGGSATAAVGLVRGLVQGALS